MENYSRNDWLKLHNSAARDYINSEWSREVLLCVAKKRNKLFAQATGSVLDVGCGYGMNLPYLINAAHITGIDFSPVMLDKARTGLRASNNRIDLQEGDAEALQFPDNVFDTVISTLSTCSFFDPIKALQEMRRVCKPEGRILLIEHGRSSLKWVGNYQDRHVRQQIEKGGCRWNQEPHELVKKAGLKILHDDRSLLGIFHTMVLSPGKLTERHD
jgi:ubiquinone/menaquinone biosynthesis C-methylase UbiE